MSTERRSETDLSVWNQDAALRYAVANHGPDGAQFLDRDLYRLMEGVAGKDFADLGTGAGVWSKHALDRGAKSVAVLDLNEAMLEQARIRLAIDGQLPTSVKLIKANVNDLPFPARKFHLLASINVGCNLPSDIFEAHFKEALRVARKEAVFVVTAPDSLLIPFTSTGDAGDLQAEIDKQWKEAKEHTVQAAKEMIGGFRDLLRATFVLDETGKPVLVTEENAGLVSEGTPIIRRIPGLVVDNNFHTAESYANAAEKAGWIVEKIIRKSFTSEEERIAYHQTVEKEVHLGPEYVGNPPFLVMELKAA